MPNWAGSDWYFLRYYDPHNAQVFASMEKLRYWMPVDVYIGGDEHNTLHLLYSRFIYHFLHDIGASLARSLSPTGSACRTASSWEPDGQRMSKSRGNVIVPDELVDRYGADVVRAYLMFIGPFDATMAWNERALMGVKRFLDRLAAFIRENAGRSSGTDPRTRAVVDRLVKAVGEDISAFKFNTAIAKQMEALNDITGGTYQIGQKTLSKLVQVVAPFAPFLAEEYWQILRGEGSVHASRWPEYDPALITGQKVTLSVQVNGKLRGLVEVDPGAGEESVIDQAKEIEAVQRALAGGTLRKVIYVKDRTLNFVVG